MFRCISIERRKFLWYTVCTTIAVLIVVGAIILKTNLTRNRKHIPAEISTSTTIITTGTTIITTGTTIITTTTTEPRGRILLRISISVKNKNDHDVS